MKFLCSRAILRLADEEARERISVDAVRGVGPLRMIRRKVNRTAVAAGVRCRYANQVLTEVEGNTVTSTSVSPLILVPGLYGTESAHRTDGFSSRWIRQRRQRRSWDFRKER